MRRVPADLLNLDIQLLHLLLDLCILVHDRRLVMCSAGWLPSACSRCVICGECIPSLTTRLIASAPAPGATDTISRIGRAGYAARLPRALAAPL
jgi:hypothetical protein